ncbi:PAS domain S-box protein [Adhaeribacter rhizoryzae]|uniref:histidine kinase n=2 Tax=Adhaeribacter rhizoryzae TaxID=2607907 RepID=A0A5M6DEV7_9BACT|nr:PAS domain S-box protein [Adhaeribacter rhizoryzae]
MKYAHPDFVHHWQELQESLWNKQIPSFQIETCLLKKDGTVLWCQVTSILILDQNTKLGYTIVEDINLRKRLEQKLQKLYDNQETIMHMIVHDLKNYLLNIKLLNELLQENLVHLPAPDKEGNLTIIRKSFDNYAKAYALVEDILLIGRLDLPAEETFEKTDLNIYIPEHLKSISLEAEKKKIQINFQHSAEPVYAAIIALKFSRLLENLLTNAVKFTPSGGQVTISVKNIDKKALLQVSDTGIGIPLHLQKNMFQKFTKANRVGTAGESTTGLGLYIVKQIVEKHKGKIWVESQENAGTSFFIQLN